MSNGSESPQQYHQEHRALAITIDGLYVETVLSAAFLNRYLCCMIGPIREPYLAFYSNFIALFMITSSHKEMEPFKELTDKIERWGTPSNHIDRSKCMAGIKYFNEYKAALIKSGIISVKK